MKFNILKKKENNSQVSIEPQYEDNPNQRPTTSQYRPKTSQSRFGGSNFINNKKKEYNDEEDYDDEVDYDGELGDDPDDDEEDDEDDFDRKYRKEMKDLKQKLKPQKTDDISKETQKILHETFDNFYERESEVMINMIEESRDDIKNSVVELMREQQSLKEDLTRLSNGRYGKAKKDNIVSLSMYLKRKRGETGLISEAFAAGSTTDFGSQQTLSDKLAVEKYVKKKERQKVAETNRMFREKTTADLENETKEILTKLQAVDLSKEKERERQMEKIKMKLKNKNTIQKNDQEVANEIMENYNESAMAFEREKQLQQERIRARLNAVKDADGRPLTGIQRREYTSSDGFQTRQTKNVAAIDI